MPTLEQFKKDLAAADTDQNFDSVVTPKPADIFETTQKYDGFYYDAKHKLIKFQLGMLNKPVVPLDDVISAESSETGGNGHTKKHGLGRAVAGGVLAGPVGAVVGGVTGHSETFSTVRDLRVTIETKTHGELVEKMIFSETKTSSLTYKLARHNADQMVSDIEQLIGQNTSNEQVQASPAAGESVADQLTKLKALLDSGALTQAEFDGQKAKLLK